jgi:hypothetical protein
MDIVDISEKEKQKKNIPLPIRCIRKGVVTSFMEGI